LFEKHPSGISASQHHMLHAASEQWNCKNTKTYCGELVNYIPDKTEENLLTASSIAREVSARVKLLQATQYVANSWRELSSKMFQNCFAPCGFTHSSLETPNMANTENEAILELQHIRNYEEFVCMGNSLQRYNENKDYEDAILVQIAANTKRQQKTRKVMSLTHLSLNKSVVTSMTGNILLNYNATSCRKATNIVLDSCAVKHNCVT